MSTTLAMDHPLAKLLRQRRLAEPADLAAWQEAAKTAGQKFDAYALEKGHLQRTSILELLENHHFCQAKDVRESGWSAAALRAIPREIAERHHVLPVDIDERVFAVVIADPTNERALDELRGLTHLRVQTTVGIGCDIDDKIAEYYGRLDAELAAVRASSPDQAPAQPIKRRVKRKLSPLPLRSLDNQQAVEKVLRDALDLRATDIHFEPHGQGLSIRYRIDGILAERARLPKDRTNGISSRLKVLAHLDIAEHRLPQDGRARIRIADAGVDLRVSVVPCRYGEKTVLRLLRHDTELMGLDRLGFPPALREQWQQAIDDPIGLYLVTGPTGSGKTTTLYATLAEIDRASLNVSTLEDPIEYELPGLTQMQVHDAIGFTFASGLRALMRQDPDAILVGEIRDLETVEVAARAALTGHKVLSTLHTNDSVQAVSRLMDMGTAPHLIAATLRGVLAQRLVRTICEDCRVPYQPSEAEKALLGYAQIEELFQGEGCRSCSDTGYRGRMALYEYFRLDESMHRLILDRASPYALRYAAQQEGMVTLAAHGRKAVMDGKTTVEELHRVVLADEEREQLCSSCQHVVSLDFTICPFCNHTLKEQCPGCGAHVEEDWEGCPSCGSAIERVGRLPHCGNCLAPVQPDWERCRYCDTGLKA